LTYQVKSLKVQEEDLEMEQLKTNILNLVSGEHESTYSLARQVLAGIESEEVTAESKTAAKLFNAIIRWADARKDINDSLNSLIRVCEEHKQLVQTNRNIHAGFVQTDNFYRNTEKAQGLQDEIHTLCWIAGLNTDQIGKLYNQISSLIDFNK